LPNIAKYRENNPSLMRAFVAFTTSRARRPVPFMTGTAALGRQTL
jgi:hypothetical protein